ncbi:MAG: hypothetical protein WC815_06915 [Vicinamibacterales bacterium]|jgi:hypothetical protein
MKQIITAVVVSVLVSLGLGYWLMDASVQRLRQEMAAGQVRTDQQISQVAKRLAPKTVPGSSHVFEQGRCKSITTGTIRLAVGDTVEWTVGDFSNCLKGGWVLEYRFDDPTYVDPPLPTGAAPATGWTVVISAKALKAGRAKYKVWRTRTVGTQKQEQLLEDPELEIVM